MNANLLVRMKSALNGINRTFVYLFVVFFLSFLAIGQQAYADDTFVLTIHDPDPICGVGVTVDLTLPAITAGSTPDLTYEYFSDPVLTINIPDPKKVGNGTYYIRGTRVSPLGIGVLSVHVIISPPSVGGTISGATVCSGSTSGVLTLSGQTGVASTWQSSTDPFTSWTNIPNTDSITTYTSGALFETTHFRALIQSGTACSKVFSDEAIVLITPSSIGGTISGATDICSGSNSAELTLSGQTGTVVKWQSSVSPFSAWTDIPNNTTSYSSGPLSVTTQFRAVLQNGSCPAVNSASATVNVNPTTVGGNILGGVTICYGSSGELLTLTGQTGTVIKWQSSILPYDTWIDISNTATTYDPGILIQATRYRAVVQSGNCPALNSNSATVTVSPTTVAGTVLGSTALCTGSTSGVLTLTGQTGTIIEWQSSVSPFTTWIDIANSTTTYTSGLLTESTQFRAVVQSGNCGPANSLPATVTVFPTSIGGVVSGGSTICIGSTSSLLSLTGQTGTVVKWQSSVAPFSDWTDIAYTGLTYTSGTLTQTTSFRAVVQSGSCAEVNSTPTTVIVSPLTVAGAVTGGTTICTGSSSTVLTLSGQTGDVIKWQSAVSPFTSWTDIANTTTTYTSGVLTQDTEFRAVVQSGSCALGISLPALVTVSPLAVGGTVTGGTTICSGSSSDLLTLSGQTGTVVRWQSSVSPFSTWTDIANTSTTYSSGALTQTTQFRAVVQNTGCPEVYSSSTTVTVSPPTIAGAVTGGSAICTGSTSAELTLSGQTGTVVKWQSSVSPFSLWTDIANTLITYSSGVLSETTQFRAVVQSGSCLSVNSTPATVTISPLTVGGTVTGGTTICSGSASDVLTLSGHTGTVVKWQSSVSPFSTWTDISSTATAFTSSALTQTTQFRAVVQSGNCPTENSSITTVTVDPASVGGNVTGGTTICTGSTSGLLSLSGQTGSVVKWQSSVAPFDTWTDIVNTATTYSSPALTQTTEFRAVVQNGNCSEATSVPGIVTVSPLSVGGTILGATTICIGSPAILTLSGQTGDVIKWQSAVAPFTSWTDIPYTSTPYTSGSLTQETQFRAVVQSGSCAPANSLPISVTISPASVGGDVTGGTTICSGTASGVLTISGQTGSVVKWQSSVAPFSAWTDIPNTSTSYTSGSLSETTEFRAIVQNAVCPEVNSTSTTVTVDPPTTGGIVSGGTAICTGSTSAVLTLSGQTGNVIKWQNSVSPFSSWTDIANTLMTYSSGVLSETTQFRAVVQSGTCLPVNSLPDTVAVSPLTVGGTVTGGTTICSGSTSDVLTLSGHTGTVVKWQSSVSPFSDWTDIASSATAFTSPALTQTTQFRAIIQSGNCPEAFSASTLVTVDPTSVGGNVAGGTTICTGSASGLLSLSGQTGTVVKWQSSVSPFSDWTDIANNATTYTSGTLTQTTAFRAVVQSGSCVEVNSASTTVTVSPLTIAGTVSGGSTICTGSISAVLTLSGQTGDVIKWQSAVAPFTSWIDISNTTTTYTSGALTQDMQFRAYVQSGGCTPDVSLPATVTISPVTIGGTITGGSTICSGSASEVLTLSGQTGTVVKWQSSVAPFTTWTDIPNTANTYTALSLTDTTSFRAVVQSGSCPEVNSASTLVDVTPSVSTPVFTLGSTSARCQGSSSVLYTASAANSTALTYSLDAASLTGGNSIDSNSGLVTYAAAWSGTSTITANAVGCNEPTMTTHIVTITSPPFATILYDTPLCNADLTEHPVVITGSAGGTFSAGEGLRINTSSGAIIPGLSSPGTYTVLYTIAAYGGCRAYSNSSQVQILSIPVMEYITVKNVTCTGSSDGSLVAKAAGAGTFIYQWTGPLSYMSTESSISGLNPGIYTLKVTNENGCSLLVTDTIAESATALSLTLNGTNPTKSGELNGKIDASIIGGTGPFTFSWTGTGSFTAATQNIVGLKYGTYNLSVTDKNGCIKTGLQILLDPPSAVDDTSSTTEDIPVTFNVVSNDFDNDGTIVPSSVDLDPLTAGQQTTFNDVNKGVFTVSATGEVTFTPVLQFFGIAAIQYIVMDNNGLLSNSATITVTVKSNNKPPIAVDDNIIIAEHNTATGNLFANDIDPEGLPLKLGSFLIGANSYLPGETATLTDIGNIIINLDGSFVYVPYQHYFGTVPPITYKVVDDEGLSALANLNITVTPVNDPPVAVDDNFTTKEHTKLEGNVLSNDYDIKGEALVLNTIPIKAPTHGSLILIASGDFIYQPIIDFVGNDTFTYQVCDNGVPPLCSTATATIVITKNDTCEVVVPNAFTPNGDGIHDYLKIRCLYKYDNSEMQIFNRNGNLLFKKEHYGNLDFWGSEEQAYWNGRSENKWNLTSDGLPVGTYYYILKLGDGKVLTGFIFLGK